MELPYVPDTSYGHASLGDDGEANKLFLTILFSNTDLGIQFLKYVGLLRSKVPCKTCGRDVTWCPEPNRRTVSDGDVEEELLSYALRRSLSGPIHGSSRVNSL
jgi:hypothetical protein